MAAGTTRTLRGGVPRAYEYVEGWGMTVGAHGRVLRPRSIDELRDCLALARREGVSLGLRGGGNSYGDASVNRRGHTLDCTRMNRILGFDSHSGVAELEAGVTIEQLWKHILPLGFWPRVVSGTMFPTVGGAASMNIHGKNNFAVGTFGDAIDEFDLMTADGELVTANRERNSDLFHAAIGGLGMLGVFTRVVLRTKRVHSGFVRVRAQSSRNLGEMMAYMEAHRADADYLVGWIDCFGAGEGLGRGLIHHANYLGEGEDPDPADSLRVERQELPANILGVIPKGEVWRLLRCFNHDLGMRCINFAKYQAGKLEAHGDPYLQSHAGFAFLLDYVPNWKWAYGRQRGSGLIQYQTFLPKERAHAVFTRLLEDCQRAGLVPYLGVFKRHRPDPFWLTHAVDGWSFAMDFKVTPSRREDLWAHCARMTDVVVEAGGRFYFAKDLVLSSGDPRRFFPARRLADFGELKRRLDPEGRFETDLWRRAFADRSGVPVDS